ncbi:hypothetical protein Taro_025881 [Colocasia esculenta]|uniref:Uncharacterized protein n=1 Tax=Colocasia esculenta TaxID=4460 RepID=A0A843VLV2_COLES|nr:hypothetical protein [Colocasia esculenta]
MPRTFRGSLPGAGQLVILLAASLLVAPEPFGEARRETVVRPDYGGCGVLSVFYLSLTRREASQQRQGERRAEESGR